MFRPLYLGAALLFAGLAGYLAAPLLTGVSGNSLQSVEQPAEDFDAVREALLASLERQHKLEQKVGDLERQLAALGNKISGPTVTVADEAVFYLGQDLPDSGNSRGEAGDSILGRGRARLPDSSVGVRARARWEAHEQALEARFSSADSTGLAAQRLAAIASAFASIDAFSTALGNADCKDTLCRVDYNSADAPLESRLDLRLALTDMLGTPLRITARQAAEPGAHSFWLELL
jgi:hypothetical protein